MAFLIGLMFLGASLAVAFILPVMSFLRASRALRRSEALERELAALRALVAPLLSRIDEPPVADVAVAEASAPSAAAADWAAQVRALSADRRTSPTATTADDGLTAAADGLTATSEGDRRTSPTATTADDGLTATGARISSADALEERIGARWLLYAGIGALVLGVSYFIKFAFDNGWVSEPLRVLIGLLAGVALLVTGQRFVRSGLAFFGHALSGGGIIVLYVAIYAALHVYDLIGPTVAFAGMVGVTVVATALADRHRMQALGVLAVAGGFATPLLVGGGRDAQVVLCTYVAMLLAGTLALVVRHGWAGVAALAYVLTGVTWLAWGSAFYTPVAWLRTMLFLTVHLALMIGMLVVLRRREPRSLGAAPTVWLLLTAPLAYHAVALVILGRFQGRLLVYLLLATVAGLSASYHAGWRWARPVVLVLVAVPLIEWMSALRLPRWYSPAIVTACAVYLLHLAGQWRDLSDDAVDAPLPLAEIVHTHATGLFLPLALYVFFSDRFAWWNPPMLTAAALWNAALAELLRRRTPVLWWHFLALSATLAAIAVSEWFDGPVVAIGWAMEGAALGWAALRSPGAADSLDVAAGRVRRTWLLRGSLLLFVLAAFRLVDSLIQPMPLGSWPILNTRTLAAALVIGAMTWLAARVKEEPAQLGGAATRHALILGAHVLTIGWMSAEISLIFGERAYASSAVDLPAGVARAELAEQVALSVAWALYAVGLVAAGFRRHYPPARYLAIALFGLTIVKVMTKDIAELDRVYQMLSVLGVGLLLVSASYLYQRMAATRDSAARRDQQAAADTPASTFR